MSDADIFADELAKLHEARRTQVVANTGNRIDRVRLTAAQRTLVLLKTDGRCHLCGGQIDPSESWQADHVLAYSAGGEGTVENYLAAHALCNNYRWHYDAREFQWILKLGVWLRTQIERKTAIGRLAAQQFTEHEARRARRRKRETENPSLNREEKLGDGLRIPG